MRITKIGNDVHVQGYKAEYYKKKTNNKIRNNQYKYSQSNGKTDQRKKIISEVYRDTFDDISVQFSLRSTCGQTVEIKQIFLEEW